MGSYNRAQQDYASLYTDEDVQEDEDGQKKPRRAIIDCPRDSTGTLTRSSDDKPSDSRSYNSTNPYDDSTPAPEPNCLCDNSPSESETSRSSNLTVTKNDESRTVSTRSATLSRPPAALARHDVINDKVPVPRNNDDCASRLRVELPASTLLTPGSFYEPHEPGFPVMSEKEALESFVGSAHPRNRSTASTEIQLDDFTVYNTARFYGTEMKPLQHFHVKSGFTNYHWNGALTVGDETVFVRGVPILSMPIGNYGSLEHHTVKGRIWFTSTLAGRANVYYKLGEPATEYKRFFDPFLWVADLAKHFVDFLMFQKKQGIKVTIHHFENEFSEWIRDAHGHSTVFWRWAQQHPSNDYRTSITANAPFLRKKCIDVLGDKDAMFHVLWSEILDFKRYNPVSPVDPFSTIVTQYVYDCFKHLPFGNCLQAVDPCKKTQDLRKLVLKNRRLEMPAPIHLCAKSASTATAGLIRTIKPGDTVSTPRDPEESGTSWRREVSCGFADIDRWFALVLKVHADQRGRRSFDVVWYYRPVDTLCGLMKYPWNNELFLSDHCSCEEASKICEDEILGVHEIEFHGSSMTNAEFFCRSTYLNEERRWVTLEDDHLRCEHMADRAGEQPQFQIGDTILIHHKQKSNISQPCVIANLNMHGPGTYWVRILERRKDVDGSAAYVRPNELLYSSRFTNCTADSIIGRCHVRCFPLDEDIPAPYNRDGVGNYFYLTDASGSFAAKNFPPRGMRQGFNPLETTPKLRGLDLFCGGGNFGRGLEDGGAVQMQWINDYDKKAIHTYMANTRSVYIDPFVGSVDDLQRAALDGRFSKSVPRVGDVDFISGGSPCPGFSHLTNDKTTPEQRKNQSLVASFASFVDLYRPKYGVLENVVGIVQAKRSRDQDVFSQLICAIVGLGYQAQLFLLDASACGSPQRRTRVFVVFAAPGYKLPDVPAQTHAHPPDTRPMKLGNLPTGEPMAERKMPGTTSFPFVSAEDATEDLPPLYDAKPDICVQFPDHRVGPGHTQQLRDKIYHIPVWPLGMNFSQAWYGVAGAPGSGVLTAAEREYFPPDKPHGKTGRSSRGSKAYGRQHPDKLIETVTTRQSPSDFKAGRTLHWRENRTMSVMEARRAQGFRDEEVILGPPAQQLRIVGNSVAREVSLALGLVFREAWMQSQGRDVLPGAPEKVEPKAVFEGSRGSLKRKARTAVNQGTQIKTEGGWESEVTMSSSTEDTMQQKAVMDARETKRARIQRWISKCIY